MKKGILIIGGGTLQIPAIQKAKELGYRTHLFDGSLNCDSMEYADFFYHVNIKDHEASVTRALELHGDGLIHGVYTQGCDCDYLVSLIAQACGFNVNSHTSIESAQACYDKVINREILQPINPVKFISINESFSDKDVILAIKDFGLPCIIKPVNNSASRGVTKINKTSSQRDILNAIEYAFKNTYHNEKYIIVEELLTGVEYSVDTIVHNDVLYPCGISDRVFIADEINSVQKGSMTPSLLPTDVQAKMYELMDKARLLLGVNNTAFKGDLIVTNDGTIKIIEVTCRTSGGFDSQYRKPLSFGIDMLKFTIEMAMGDSPEVVDIVPKWVKFTMTTSVMPPEGKVTDCGNWEALLAIEGVKYAYTNLKVGDIIKYVNCASRVNHIVIQADTYAELIKLEAKIQKTLKIKVD